MLNRESFFAALDGSRRKTDRGALLIIDADHFKKINDSFGHLTGDDALLEIAAAIGRAHARRRHRSAASAARNSARSWPAPTTSEAARVAERIRREVELIRFQPPANARRAADRQHRRHACAFPTPTSPT